MALIVSSRASRMVSVDDFVSGGVLAGGARPIRPHAAILGCAAASASMPARGAGVSRDFDASHPTIGRHRPLQLPKQWREPCVRERQRSPGLSFTNEPILRWAFAARALFKIS